MSAVAQYDAKGWGRHMDSGFWSAVNGARRSELRMEILSNNLANVNTNGFKSDQITFDTFLTQPGPELFPLPTDTFMGTRGPGDIPFPFSNPATNAYNMTYPVAFETSVDVAQGPLQLTGNPLHVALEGEGFFVVQSPEGRRYTRDGSFEISATGELVNKNGHAVLGTGGAPLAVGNGPISIADDGTLSGPNGVIGQLARVTLPQRELEKVGMNLYRVEDQAMEQPVPAGSGAVIQGHLEGSNANVVRSMTQMIETQRAFESYMKMIQTLDGLDNQAVNQVGRLQNG
ncbi:MAG: flagellar basal-body rod protein FlgF [Magnetococcus sp. WYHC-3]